MTTLQTANLTVVALFCDTHGPFDLKVYSAQAKGKAVSDEFDLVWGLTVNDLVHTFHIKTICFVCIQTNVEEEEEDASVAGLSESETPVHALQVLMSTSREKNVKMLKTTFV